MRDWTEQLKELRAQFDEQNAQLDQVWNTLGSLGDSVELSVPQAVLDEIDDAASSFVSRPQTPTRGIRV